MLNLSERSLRIIFAAMILLLAAMFFFTNVVRVEDRNSTDLLLWREIEIDEPLRILLMQRLAILEAGIDAYELAGEEVSLSLYSFLAETAWFLGDLGTARTAYEAMLSRNAINYVTWNNYANVLKEMGDVDGALDAYAQALRLHPSEEYYRDYVTLLLAQYPERTEEAIDLLTEAVSQIDQTPWLMLTLAELYLEVGDCDRALAHYEVARSIVSDEQKQGVEEEMRSARTACKEQ